VAGDGHLPTVYNYNFGVQRALPMNMVLDAAYVGSLSRHETELVPFNDAPFGSAWLPQNQDPTKCPNIAGCNLNGDNALPVSLYRPYVGYNGPAGNAQGVLYEFGGTANYNSLQISLNRRMSRRFQVGTAYTWSKALGVQSSTTVDGILPAADNWRNGMYGPLVFDRTQMLTVNYLFNLPDFAARSHNLDNVVGRTLLNGWQLSGITAISSGTPIYPTNSNSTSALYNISTGTGTISGAQLNREVTGSEDVPPRYVFTCAIRTKAEVIRWPSLTRPASLPLPKAAWAWIPVGTVCADRATTTGTCRCSRRFTWAKKNRATSSSAWKHLTPLTIPSGTR
jgi:hypothetical protein